MLTKEVNWFRRSGPPCLQLTKDLRCWGLRPSSPPEEPVGKEDTAFRTSSVDTVRGSDEVGGATSVGFKEQGGCLDLSLEIEASDGADRGSSDNNNRTVALILPSSNLS